MLIYTAKEAHIALLNLKEFVSAALDLNEEAFVVHVASPTSKTSIHLAREAQIALLNFEEASDTIPTEYSDYADIFQKNQPRCYPNVPTSMGTLLIEKKVNNHLMHPSTA